MALMHDSGTTILERDALGRIGYARGQREAWLDEFERSGLKGAAFARTVGEGNIAGILMAGVLMKILAWVSWHPCRGAGVG